MPEFCSAIPPTNPRTRSVKLITDLLPLLCNVNDNLCCKTLAVDIFLILERQNVVGQAIWA